MATKLQQYFETFFEEKDLPVTSWSFEIDGTLHIVESTAVIEAIKTTGAAEQRAIRDTLVRLDFDGADILDYLKHLARGLAETYQRVYLKREAAR